MIDLLTLWFEITQYENKIATSIANLVETKGLTIYTTAIEITYDQGS